MARRADAGEPLVSITSRSMRQSASEQRKDAVMNLRRLVVALAAVAALFATSAAAFPAAGAGEADRPQPLPALTSQALSQRYHANARAIARDARAARQAGNAQLTGALGALRTRPVLFFDPRGQGLAGVVIGNLATAPRVAILVPGSDTTLSTFFSRGSASPGGGAAALAVEARRLQPGTHLAIIAWLGYRAPATLSTAVLTSSDAEA